MDDKLKTQILAELEQTKFNDCKRYLINHCGMKEDVAVARLNEMFEHSDIASEFALFCMARGQDPAKSIYPLVLGYTPKKLMAPPHNFDAYGAFYSLCQLRNQGEDGPLFKHLRFTEMLNRQPEPAAPKKKSHFEPER